MRRFAPGMRLTPPPRWLAPVALMAVAYSSLCGAPLKVGPNRRYLVDGNGRPVFLQGDTAWSLISALTKQESERYLEDRRRKGFNAIVVNLIEHKYGGPVNREGHGPFLDEHDFTAPDERYFAHADWVLRRAAEKGIQVLLAPMYLGYKGSDEGWYGEALSNGPERCRQYGRWLGKRYKDFSNLIWVMGGDRDPEEATAATEALAAGIREFAGGHLFTAHAAPEHSGAAEYFLDGRLDLNTTYTYGIVHKMLLRDYSRRPTLPYIFFESTYEGEHNASAVQIRRQAWWALLCGAAGQIFGNRPLWEFARGWQQGLDSQGSRDMTHLHALLISRPWHELVPDRRHAVVTGGLGEFHGLDYLAAAYTADRRTLIAYSPSARSITVNLEELAGPSLLAWWFDPRTGRVQRAGRFRGSGTRGFRTPGDGDWVLVVEDAGLGLAPPGDSMR